ncbi:phosphoserine phosphatase SerB [Pontivivens insulae]|uniref:Phosphoserine phosphatase n=1 Tax=Pontivivens insulae TaxID=1639689 RepID=A0A2R8AC26_9RHOB|nr:phosphoserine phosphatase SerB [Pontivivens insulae]RED11039.1 phosphoserine phosphatase [Pontivivens insulae]SPF29786.1 Phosphoserine phosphatase [Pontivivens insulae]
MSATHALVLTAAVGISDRAVAGITAALGAVPVALEQMCAEWHVADGVLPPRPEGHDLNIVSLAGRAKRLLIADMDSTMIPVECIDELADFAGVKDRVADITERAMQGELDFEEAIHERVGLLTGLPQAALEQCYAERIALNPGAEVLVRTMAGRGAMTALVSGGFTFFTSRVAARAGFALNRANTLLFDDSDHLTGKVGLPILGREAKRETLLELCDEGGFGPDAVIAVGDGANDLAMVEIAGLGVAYKAKPALKAGANCSLENSDLTALLSLQGIREGDWVNV